MQNLPYISFHTNALRLLEQDKSLAYAAHGLHDVLVAGGVAHAYAVGVAESLPPDCGHVSHIEKIHGEVHVI